MNDDQKRRKSEQRKLARLNWTPEQREAARIAGRKADAKRKGRNRVCNLTPEQIEKQRARDCARWPKRKARLAEVDPTGEKAKAYRHNYYLLNRDKISARAKVWNQTKRAELTEYHRRYRALNPDKVLAQRAARAAANPGKETERQREYRKANPEKRRQYKRDRRERDPQYRVRENLRSRLYSALMRYNQGKKTRTMSYIGCDMAWFIAWFEVLFTEGMTWQNVGAWEIDHIRPCASFDLTDPEQAKCCFHWTNLQPMWRAANRSKAASWEGEAAA